MNCQQQTEHEGQNQPLNAEQQPMETLDYLRLASFIRYITPDPSGVRDHGDMCLDSLYAQSTVVPC